MSWLDAHRVIYPDAHSTQSKCPNLVQGRNLNSQLSTAISASILLIEPQDHHQPTHRGPVNGFIMILRFFG